ncbi:Flp family type IVb pilin [Lichenicoccus roseus]|uniref:Flp family type IVb pilin n=1 Tax=Lichenicoccus roseus TaxID=2683649 RepID=A0A5R9JEI1_9PROT|nr:Flp family type IVb pilin [Lichenicoccus roseus]TLU72708.1 Flp family type IVb pilin [Lichenicoccus roseus]
MLNLLRACIGLGVDRRGVTALEYAIIAGVLATVLVTAFTTLGSKMDAAFVAIGAKF